MLTAWESFLNGRTFYRPIAAIYTAVALQGLKPCFALLTFVKIPAGIGGHQLAFLVAANRAGDHRNQFNIHSLYILF